MTAKMPTATSGCIFPGQISIHGGKFAGFEISGKSAAFTLDLKNENFFRKYPEIPINPMIGLK